MLSESAARAKVLKVFDRKYPLWAASGSFESLSVPLTPPTDKQVTADPAGVAQWIRQWSGVPGVVWESRKWANAGTQEVPVRLVLDSAADTAVFVRQLSTWKLAVQRAEQLLGLPSESHAALQSAVVLVLKKTMDLPAEDFERLFNVLQWLGSNPSSGLYPRQIPVLGVDSKWLERHRTLVKALHVACTGATDLGLAGIEKQYRVKFLDSSLAPGGLRELSASAAQLAGLVVEPRVVLVVENLQSMLSLPDMEGAIAVHGAGYDVSWVAGLPWTGAARVLYWGDLDADGFSILSRLRAHRPDAVSVMMDAGTYLAYRGFAVDDPNVPGALPGRLTAGEAQAWAMVVQERGRLEQERIPWDAAVETLRNEMGAVALALG